MPVERMHPLGPGCGGEPTVAVLCGAAARSVGSGMDLGLQVGFSVGGKAPEPDGHECRLLAGSVSPFLHRKVDSEE